MSKKITKKEKTQIEKDLDKANELFKQAKTLGKVILNTPGKPAKELEDEKKIKFS